MKELVIFISVCAASIMAMTILYHQVTKDDETSGND
jgi:hypothetical protein